VTGGDSVMDVFEAKRGRADELRRIFRDTLRRECSVPVHHVTGNHDIFGWDRGKSGTSGTEADWGKRFACDLFGVPRTWHSFDHGAWRFVCLDSVQPKGDGYVGYLDEEQFDWLQNEYHTRLGACYQHASALDAIRPEFERHAACHPDERGHAGAEHERCESDTLVVGTGRGQPPGQIAFRFGVRLAVVCPRADGERLGGWLGSRGHNGNYIGSCDDPPAPR
jgi:3',5'-cyclic AMP phosphodiesterase CpdA